LNMSSCDGVAHGRASKRARVVIVMQHQLETPFKFAVPSNGTLVCVQLDSGWKLLPPEYPKSQKMMELQKTSDKITSFVLDDAGAFLGGTGFTWD
jgi:hypothetical protein